MHVAVSKGPNRATQGERQNDQGDGKLIEFKLEDEVVMLVKIMIFDVDPAPYLDRNLSVIPHQHQYQDGDRGQQSRDNPRLHTACDHSFAQWSISEQRSDSEDSEQDRRSPDDK